MEASRSSRLETLSLVVVCLMTAFFPLACGQCSYPSDLTGLWYTSHENSPALTWTSTNVTSFTYQTTGTTFNNLMYECLLTDGTNYVSKTTTTINLFGANFYVYTCWQFSRISANKYRYKIAVAKESRVDNARVKVFTAATTISDTATVCDDTSFTNNEYSILLRNGTIDSQKISCPDPLLATGRYTITGNSVSYCNDNSWLDVCTDSTTITANYTLCNQNVFYSASGVLYCVYQVSYPLASNTYYVTLFNSDATTDQSTTYLFTCAVVSSSSGVVYISQYPGECLNSTYMNSSYISETTGFTTVVQTNTTCVPTSSSSNNLGLILGITFGMLFLIAIIIIIIFCIYDKHNEKKKSSRSNSKVVPDTLPNTAMSHGDKNYRMMFTPAPPRSAVPGGRHVDYYDGGRAGSQTSLRPTISQLANYRTPTPIISKSKDDSEGQKEGLAIINDEPEGVEKNTVSNGEAAEISVDKKLTEEKAGAGSEDRTREKKEAEFHIEDEGKTSASSDQPVEPAATKTDTSAKPSEAPTPENNKTEVLDKRGGLLTPSGGLEVATGDKNGTPERRAKTATATREALKKPKHKRTASRNSNDRTTPTPKRAWSSGSRRTAQVPSPNPDI